MNGCQGLGKEEIGRECFLGTGSHGGGAMF